MAVKYKMDEDARDKLDERSRVGESAIKLAEERIYFDKEERETYARDIVSDILTALFGPAGYCVYGSELTAEQRKYSIALDGERGDLARTFLDMALDSWEGDAEDYTATLVTVDNPLLPKESSDELKIERVPGKGNREIIDTTYEVRLNGELLDTFSNTRDADYFVAGYKAAERS